MAGLLFSCWLCNAIWLCIGARITATRGPACSLALPLLSPALWWCCSGGPHTNKYCASVCNCSCEDSDSGGVCPSLSAELGHATPPSVGHFETFRVISLFVCPSMVNGIVLYLHSQPIYAILICLSSKFWWFFATNVILGHSIIHMRNASDWEFTWKPRIDNCDNIMTFVTLVTHDTEDNIFPLLRCVLSVFKPTDLCLLQIGI